MRHNYQQPSTVVVKVKIESPLLDASINEINGNAGFTMGGGGKGTGVSTPQSRGRGWLDDDDD